MGKTKETEQHTLRVVVIVLVIIAAGAYLSFLHNSPACPGCMPVQNVSNNSQSLNSNLIIPGPLPSSECPAQYLIGNYLNTSVNIVSVPGFGVYNISALGLTDYVLAPGQNGTISYRIDLIANVTNHVNSNSPTKISNNVTLSHETNVTAKLNITKHYVNFTKYVNGTLTEFNPGLLPSAPNSRGLTTISGFNFLNGETLIFPNGTLMNFSSSVNLSAAQFPTGVSRLVVYLASYNKGTSWSLGPQNPKSNYTNYYVTNYTTPGLNLTLSPVSETLSPNQLSMVNLTVTAALNATPGTYFMVIEPEYEVCGGRGHPFALLTIGTSPYSGGRVYPPLP